jgi:hypothetical protein
LVGRVYSAEDVEWVSFLNLIATPKVYDGKRVYVAGYAKIEFENTVLCLMPEPPSGKECLWLTFYDGKVTSEEEYAEYESKRSEWERRYHGRLISLKGTFDMTNSGHLGNQSGSIKEITDVWVK